MPPKNQKRERDVPRQTLLDFFGAKPPLEITPKAARMSKPKPCKPKASASAKKNAPPQEIIVIESDSDQEPEIIASTTAKRRKLSSKHDDTSLVLYSEHHAPLANVSIHSKEKSVGITPQSFMDFSRNREVSGSFGTPFLLLSSPPQSVVTESTASSFGKPFLLTPPSPPSESIVSRHNDTLSGIMESCPLKSKDITIHIDLTLDDWENGDDEDAPEPTVDSEGDDEIEWVSCQESQSAGVPRLDSLSLCSTFMNGSEKGDGLMIDRDFSGRKGFELASTSAGPHCRDDKPQAKNSNAFSVLMSASDENEIWKEATMTSDKKLHMQKSNGGRRKAPFYKVLQGMPIAVDAFNYGAIPEVTAYFLTHAHSDHYTNLSSSWKNGPIYCSQGTANLIIHMLSVDPKWIRPLPMDTPTVIPNTNGVAVTLIEANHCPGSCLFFFEGPQTVNAGDSTFKSSSVGSSKTFRYLHCGDFRASPKHVLHPAVQGKVIDHVYLDTTYLDPKYTFPPQPLVISACAELVKRIIHGQPTKEKTSTVLAWMFPDSTSNTKKQSKPLIVIGTYSIGKERIAKAIACALNSKIYCDARKTAILKCQADPELHRLLTSDPMEGIVHLVPLSTVTSDCLKTYLERFRGCYDRVIGFRPTGWTYIPAAGTNQMPTISTILSAIPKQDFTFSDLELSRQSTPTLQLYPVPYSEHSSFYELTCFAMSFTWIKMIATVNVGSESSRGKMSKWVAKWEAERKRRGKDTIVAHRHPEYW